MQITVNVVLDADEAFPYTAQDGAAQVLTALGGDTSTDYCVLSVTQNAAGTAGTLATDEAAE